MEIRVTDVTSLEKRFGAVSSKWSTDGGDLVTSYVVLIVDPDYYIS